MSEVFHQPSDMRGLFKFYNEYVRLLYGAVQAENELPQEVLFEINAAFDHISRIYTYGKTEQDEVDKAFSHLKRSCLDIFKLKVKKTVDNYNDLRRIDTSIIDNGNFDKSMHVLIAQIKEGTVKARQQDAASDHDEGAGGFREWTTVYSMCEQFDREFFRNQHVQWARSKNRMFTLKQLLMSVGASLFAGFVFSCAR